MAAAAPHSDCPMLPARCSTSDLIVLGLGKLCSLLLFVQSMIRHAGSGEPRPVTRSEQVAASAAAVVHGATCCTHQMIQGDCPCYMSLSPCCLEAGRLSLVQMLGWASPLDDLYTSQSAHNGVADQGCLQASWFSMDGQAVEATDGSEPMCFVPEAISAVMNAMVKAYEESICLTAQIIASAYHHAASPSLCASIEQTGAHQV
jgi:hypothetical protein